MWAMECGHFFAATWMACRLFDPIAWSRMQINLNNKGVDGIAEEGEEEANQEPKLGGRSKLERASAPKARPPTRRDGVRVDYSSFFSPLVRK
jgi:hypothetical protein